MSSFADISEYILCANSVLNVLHLIVESTGFQKVSSFGVFFCNFALGIEVNPTANTAF